MTDPIDIDITEDTDEEDAVPVGEDEVPDVVEDPVPEE